MKELEVFPRGVKEHAGTMVRFIILDAMIVSWVDI